MLVYLLRHGVAEDLGPGGPPRDADRRLTEEGRAKLRQAAPTWQRCVADLDRIYASPLVRAAETAAVLADALDHPAEPVTLRDLAPGADPEAAADTLLADARAGLSAVAMVGHEPHLGSLLGLLLQGQGAIPLKKGMLVAVELASPATLAGRLILCLSSKLAARADK